jgi:hypothetical protein
MLAGLRSARLFGLWGGGCEGEGSVMVVVQEVVLSGSSVAVAPRWAVGGSRACEPDGSNVAVAGV